LYANGQLESEAWFADDQADGVARSCWQDGNPTKEVTCEHGSPEGVARFWYYNGQLARTDVQG
jgi:antitoxin component YwqK of YwqJK toxin-antitoxin module